MRPCHPNGATRLERPAGDDVARRYCGSGGQLSGAGVSGAPVNFPGRSWRALEGGVPDVFAGAAAHHPA